MRMISSFLFFLALLPVLGVMAHDGYKYYNNQADGLQLSSVQDVLLSYSVDALKKVEDMVPKNMLPFVFETIMPMNGLLFTILFAVCVGLTTGCFALSISSSRARAVNGFIRFPENLINTAARAKQIFSEQLCR